MSKIKKIKKILTTPKGVITASINNALYFYENSSASKNEDDAELICRELRILSHTIEKGLSLPVVRKGFGKEKVIRILELIEKYIKINNFSYDFEAFTNAIAILQRYVAESEKNACDVSFIDLNKYSSYLKADFSGYGVKKLGEHPKEVRQQFELLAKSRHSLRYFSDEIIDKELLKDSIDLAQTAPSACNRQSNKVIHIADKKLAKKILEIQGGAKGHGDSEILLIASDLSLYRYTSEFSTPYLDGGIYLMNLLYALFANGIYSCPLIWDDYTERGLKIRELLDIPKNYHIVAVIQIGYAPECANYAVSDRRDVSQILINENDLIMDSGE